MRATRFCGGCHAANWRRKRFATRLSLSLGNSIRRCTARLKDFVVKHPEHSPHSVPLVRPERQVAYRRSVYRFLARSKPQPFMTALDCADPSMQVDKRAESLSPVPALALYNNGFMLTMAKHLATVSRKPGTSNESDTVFQLALGQSPTATERTVLMSHAKSNSFPNTCRVILNLNEFVFVGLRLRFSAFPSGSLLGTLLSEALANCFAPHHRHRTEPIYNNSPIPSRGAELWSQSTN